MIAFKLELLEEKKRLYLRVIDFDNAKELIRFLYEMELNLKLQKQ